MRLPFTIFSFMIIAAIVSCKKVIELPLKGNEPKFVIEGVITNEPGVCKVHITQSVDFNAPNNFPKVSGATVTVKDNGVNFVLTETSAGVYESNAVNGTPGHHYELTVLIGGKTFTAASIMPRPVHLD